MGRINTRIMGFSKKLFGLIVAISFLLVSCEKVTQVKNESVKTGADVLISEKIDLLKNKNIGLITNHTGILSSGKHLVDTLHNLEDVNLIALFGPEHGIRGNAPDGKSIKEGIDSKTGIPVYSLYGKIKKPNSEMLKDVDLLIFDIQDIGARFYTYISTMYYTIQAASEFKIPILILDRPNPINGLDVQGPMLDTAFKSFVGIAELPIRHGMTIGELATYFNRPKVLQTDKPADLTIIKLKNWERNFYYDDCKLNWIAPSPNMPNLETALVYPGMCLIEGTNLSEGRGTYSPFLQIGSPYINSEKLLKELYQYNFEGVELSSTSYTPEIIPNMAEYVKHKSNLCNGIKLKITDRNKFKPIEFGIHLIYLIHKLYPNNFEFRGSIERLWGNKNFREDILGNAAPEKIIRNYHNKLEQFKLKRKNYLLY
ncbi:MAG: hypothetical protein CR986_07295 [Ignavibacteriae bacterium]|nr:MAG: hypothetical protein CR986_07295 [Ignavibacteriota bacterium]